jgi:hypothetical protein
VPGTVTVALVPRLVSAAWTVTVVTSRHGHRLLRGTRTQCRSDGHPRAAPARVSAALTRTPGHGHGRRATSRPGPDSRRSRWWAIMTRMPVGPARHGDGELPASGWGHWQVTVTRLPVSEWLPASLSVRNVKITDSEYRDPGPGRCGAVSRSPTGTRRCGRPAALTEASQPGRVRRLRRGH